MLNQLKSSASKAAYSLAHKKGVDCPDCTKPLQLPAVMPSEEKGETISCLHCDWFGSPSALLLDLATSSPGSHFPAAIALPASKPGHTKIQESYQESPDGDTEIILCPAPRRFNSLLFFAAIWLTFIAFFSIAALKSNGPQLNESPWLIGAFLSLFWLVGLGMLYIGIRTAFTEQLIIISEETVTHLRKMFGIIKQRTLPRDGISRVALESSYAQNDVPVYELRIHAKDINFKAIKFGSHLKDDEKDWLHYTLQQRLTPASDHHTSISGNSSMSSDGEYRSTPPPLQIIQDKHIQLAPHPSGSADTFELTIHHTYAKTFIAISIVLLIPISFLLKQVFHDFSSNGSDAPFTITLFLSLFRLIPAAIICVLSITSITLFTRGFKKLGTSSSYLFEPEKLTVSTYKKSELLKEVSYPKSSFDRLKSQQSSNNNSTPYYSLKLSGPSQSINLHRFLPGQHLAPIETTINNWLHSEKICNKLLI